MHCMEISKPQSPIDHDDEQISARENSRPGPPHEALFLALSYLPVLELLAASEACSSLRDTVKNDVIPWLNVVVQRPLSERVRDDSLVRIASMARGKMRALALVGCRKITDDGLQFVVERNPLINKLLIPGCTGLTPEGVIRAVKTLLSNQGHTLQSLHINGIYNIQKHHLQSLHSYLQLNTSHQTPQHPIIDVEICPRCDEPQMVFGCPRKSCKTKMERPNVAEHCRGCSTCIPRCRECGGCVDESEELGEAVCADVLCLDCWLQLPKCSFCNKPYCKHHAEEAKSRCSSSGLSGFVCDVCHAKFVEGLYYSDEE